MGVSGKYGAAQSTTEVRCCLRRMVSVGLTSLMSRPFRADLSSPSLPRALPWAGISCPFGAGFQVCLRVDSWFHPGRRRRPRICNIGRN